MTVQPLRLVLVLRIDSATICDSRIAQADMDWCPWASCAITVFRTTKPSSASAASSICTRFSESCPDALPHGFRIVIPAYEAVMIQAIGLPEISIEIVGQSSSREALVVRSDPGNQFGRHIGDSRQ